MASHLDGESSLGDSGCCASAPSTSCAAEHSVGIISAYD